MKWRRQRDLSNHPDSDSEFPDSELDIVELTEHTTPSRADVVDQCLAAGLDGSSFICLHQKPVLEIVQAKRTRWMQTESDVS